ncbi:MAG: hypothetical protein KJ072_22630 [Verrucomicrobia bacterium]|nr:hypothetical protein [Verrucomicrobiota bacterium]
MLTHSHRSSEPAWHRRIDRATGVLLPGLMLFSPWAFGSWPGWSIWTMNLGGYLLGLLFLIKLGIRHHTGFEPIRWNGGQSAGLQYGLGLLTVALLLWCFTSAVNARAVVDLESLRVVENRGWIDWLPHSHDRPATWFAFWQYLGLAGVFWALRDWLAIASVQERRRLKADARARPDSGGIRVGSGDAWVPHRLPHRLRRLLWVISLNGAAVALIGMVSTFDNPSKVLWLMPHEVREGGFFGPFYYRNVGAAFVNLSWPPCLGLWLTYCLRAALIGRAGELVGRSPSAILPICLITMIAAPFVSSSRGGSIVALVLLIGCLPVLILSIRASRVALIMAGLTVMVGGCLGVWLAWEPLNRRFSQEFIAYPTGIVGRLDEFMIRSKFRVPSAWGTQAATFTGLSGSSEALWNTAGSMTLSLRRPGVFEARFVETNRNRVLTLTVTNGLLAEAGRTVEVVFAHRAGESALHLNGERLELHPAKSKAGFDWPETPASAFLWVGRGAGGSMKFNDRIDAVTLFDRVLPDSVIHGVADRAPAPDSIFATALGRDRWAELEPKPRLNIRPYRFSPSQWVAAGLGGRVSLHEWSRQMMAGYPSALGSGPGTFAGLFKVFRQDQDPGSDWFAHNDFLETRITFGWIGAVMIYGVLLICLVAVFWRGGLPVPGYCVVLVVLGLVGSLLHAPFDWVFQTHALLFLGVILCGLVAGSSIRSGTRG